MIIKPLEAADRGLWETLWQGYLAFYGQSNLPQAVTDTTFARLTAPGLAEMAGMLAVDEQGGGLGLVHCVFHHNTWHTAPTCYLEDLFVAPGRRGGGVGRALIGAAESLARARNCHKLYWNTHHHNATARALYDSITPVSDFVRYDKYL